MKKQRTIYEYFTVSFMLFCLVITPFSVSSFSISHEGLQQLFTPPTPIRQPAEFEPMEGVLIRYQFGISYQIIAEMAEDVTVVTIVSSTSQMNTVLSAYASQGVNLDHCEFLIAPTDSYWTRDYGPWFIITGDDEQGVVDFTYNRPRPNDDQIPVVYANNQSIPWYFMDLVHTGGNYMTDGQG
ncbi:MAG: agmatine deiminase family protein, partial [Candidatus Thermoplasmatota archaeon]|nr:agmatine deiminase family protein [Candidatus Thermoplasmatota archaeon]